MEEFLRSITDYDWKDMNGKSGYPSWEDEIRYEGKWIANGNAEYIERKARELEPQIGGFISHMKYSSSALVVYCNIFARKDARRILESHGLVNLKWDTNMNSLRRYLENPRYNLFMSLINPKRLIELGELAGMNMKPSVESAKNLNRKLQEKMKEYKKLIISKKSAPGGI